MNSNLKFPSMRNYLIVDLDNLKDKQKQIKEWINLKFKHYFWDNLRMVLESIDDLNFNRVLDGRSLKNFQEGNTLFNSEETEAILKVILALEKVCEEIGIEQPDSTYIDSPLWDDVVSSSKEAYDLLVSNNKKYGLDFEKLWEEEKTQNQESKNQ